MTNKSSKFSWSSALMGAASVAAATAIVMSRPRDPTFHLASISFSSIKPKFPVLDPELILTVHVSNPNILPVHYRATTMSIFYDGNLLGEAQVEAGSHSPKSCRLLKLPARLDGNYLAQRGKRFLSDVAKRQMVLDAVVNIGGIAKLMWWVRPKFNVRVDSHLIIDPVLLGVIDQENKSKLKLGWRL